MDLADFTELLAPAGQAALAAAEALPPGDEHFLANLARLEGRWPAPLAKAALETATLRVKARAKFSRASAMYFTREALEQASGEAIASYRAGRFRGQATTIVDLGCGIGADSLALAEHGSVTGFDLDPLRLAIAAQNAAAYGRAERVRFVAADFTRAPLPPAEAFFFDPARRVAGRRTFSVHAYQPPLEALRGWLPQIPSGAVKISPGVDLAELAGYDGEIEFISERGELKECVLWLGGFAGASRRATLLEAGAVHSLLADPAATAIEPPGPPLAYLYEPDPAVLRAGLVTTLAAQLGARQMDADIAYLTAATLRPTPLARAFAIEAALPFQLKRLREALRARGVGRLTVKKRGSPLEPETLIQQLRLSGPEERIVFLTHVLGQPWALIGSRAEAGAHPGAAPE